PGQRNQTGIVRRLTARAAVIERSFARSDLPADLAPLRARAVETQYLRAAVDFFRSGQRDEGNRAFHTAVAARPALVADATTLRHSCPPLAPMGLDPRTEVTRHWRTTLATVRGALRDLFATPGLEPAIAALRWRSRLAFARVAMRLARRRLRAGGTA